MGYPKLIDLHTARPLNTWAALLARGDFLVRGLDSSDTTESATDGTEHGADLVLVLNELRSVRQVNAQTGTTYTTVLTDAGKLITCNNAAAVSLTIPPNSSVAYPVGTWMDIAGIGAGIVTLVAGSGVTINKPTGSTLVFQDRYSAATVTKLATDTWLAVGRFADA